MSLRRETLPAGLLLSGFFLMGCTLDSAIGSSCADCGEVRSITPRLLRNEIRLPTDAPQVITVSGTSPVPVVYDVRVRMDRGGSRDFILSSIERLRVGDRVEIRDGMVVARPPGGDWS